ncbi:MAG: hypothetical protein ACPGQS_12590, partial [Bradymonadia bacterium]
KQGMRHERLPHCSPAMPFPLKCPKVVSLLLKFLVGEFYFSEVMTKNANAINRVDGLNEIDIRSDGDAAP